MNKVLSILALVSLGLQQAVAAEPTQRMTQGGTMDLKTQIQQQRAEIFRLIGDAKAESPQQCRVLALGQKACGGPETYVAYSVFSTDEATLLKQAELYKSMQQRWFKESGMMSDCAIVPPKQVEWANGYCVLGPSADSI